MYTLRHKILRNFTLAFAFVLGLSVVFPHNTLAGGLTLPTPGTRVSLSSGFHPAILSGIKVHPNNPFHFDFILSTGSQNLPPAMLKGEAAKLLRYFLASLTVPDKDLWVNLSPYEKDRIIPDVFGQTEMGRDLLAEDYLLKQITASLIYPKEKLGREFWDRIYKEAAARFGTTNVRLNTYNKVWIVPQQVIVFENSKSNVAYIEKATLKVLLEEDYLSLKKHGGGQISQQTTQNEANKLGADILREIVVPQLNREVNEGRNFATLRQAYNSLVLAGWYKKKIKDSILNRVYLDRNKTAGIKAQGDLQNPEEIYLRYLEAFKKGVYDYVEDERDTITNNVIPRKYFSGGVQLTGVSQAMIVRNIVGTEALGHFVNWMLISVGLRQVEPPNDGPVIRMSTDPNRLIDSNEAIVNLLENRYQNRNETVVYDVGPGWTRDQGPTTTKELAGILPKNARIVAIDKQTPKIQVIITGTGSVLYSKQGQVLFWEKGTKRFTADTLEDDDRVYLEGLYGRLKRGRRFSKRENVRVIYNPVSSHLLPNMTYITADLFKLQTAEKILSRNKADIVRISNVIFPHYGISAISLALKQLLPFVNEGGEVWIGWSHPMGFMGEEHLVYRKINGAFQLVQFALGLNPPMLVLGGGWGGLKDENSIGLPITEQLRPFWRNEKYKEIKPRLIQEEGLSKDARLAQRDFMRLLATDINTSIDARIAESVGPMLFLNLNIMRDTPAVLSQNFYRLFKERYLDREVPEKVDPAMLNEFRKGGIDLDTGLLNMQIKNEGDGVNFNVDLAMLTQLQNAPGFIPVILKMQRMGDPAEFFGLTEP